MMLNLGETPDLADAACRNTAQPDAFFPGGKGGRPTRYEAELVADAIEMCESCPARVRCLEWAMAWNEEGIWGGTTDEERRLARDEPLTQDQRRHHVQRLHAEGLTDGLIAKELRVSRTVVYNDRRALDLPENYYDGEAIEERRRRLVQLHAEGLNDREIGDRLGVSRFIARRDRVTLGLPKNFTRGEVA